jgi:hypothetical protein
LGSSGRADMTTNGWGEAEFAALGKIAFNFTELEYCVDYLLSGFFKDDLVATALLSGENISWKFDKLSVLATEALKDTGVQEHLLGWVKAAKVLNDRRNELMHSLYFLSEADGSVTRMKASTRGGKWRGSSERMDLASLQEVAALLDQGVEATHSLVEQLSSCPEWHRPSQ